MIRPYQPIDKDKLVKIFKLNTPKYFDEKEVKDFENYLEERGETYYLTIELDKEIVGGIGYEVVEKDHSGRITWIFFHPNHAGQGLGSQAVEHCLNLLRTAEGLEIFKVRTSQLAYQFFTKFGFLVKRIDKDYWGEGLDLYVMEMPI